MIDFELDKVNAAYVWLRECQKNLAVVADGNLASNPNTWDFIFEAHARWQNAYKVHRRLKTRYDNRLPA